MEKKANKIAFKSEKQRQEQSMLNTKQQQGKKLWYLYILQTTIEKKSIPTYARIIPWFKILILEVLHEIHENETFFRFFNTKNGGKWELCSSTTPKAFGNAALGGSKARKWNSGTPVPWYPIIERTNISCAR